MSLDNARPSRKARLHQPSVESLVEKLSISAQDNVMDVDSGNAQMEVQTKGTARVPVAPVEVQAIHTHCMYTSAALCKDPRFVTTCGVKDCNRHARVKEVFARNNLEVDDPESYYLRPFPAKTKSGYFHFTRLGLFAHLTRNGFIVVGKLWHGLYAETLGGCEVQPNVDYGSHLAPKRLTFKNDRMEPMDLVALCQSNGLLYKVLPQENLQYHYDITNLDSLPGEGFISFPQMIRDAPALYIHYWSVWNGHITRIKEWLTKRTATPLKIYKETGVRAWINWEEVDKNAPLYGANHVIVPPPALNQVTSPDFNPFEYSHKWVKVHAPSQLDLPHFPPMYLLYPMDPAEDWKRRFEADFKLIVKTQRSLVETYHYFAGKPLALMQWVKFGHPDTFQVSRSDIPPRLRERLGGVSEWSIFINQ